MKPRNEKVEVAPGQVFAFVRPYDGFLFAGGLDNAVGLDTETELIDRNDPTHIPRVALATVSDGRKTAIVRPDQFVDFVLQHHERGTHFVCHNAAFDFEVLLRHFESSAATSCDAQKARDAWLQMCGDGRLHCTMLLDQLLRLAEARFDYASSSEEEHASVRPRNLGVCAEEYLRWRIDKRDPFRLRYSELINRDWADPLIDPGFWSYAVKDAIAVRFLYRKLVERAKDVLGRVRRVYKTPLINTRSEHNYGYLTESLQLRGAIALRQASRNGIKVDVAAAEAEESKTRQSLRDSLSLLVALTPKVFRLRAERKKVDAEGQTYLFDFLSNPSVEDIAFSPKGTPVKKTKSLIRHLNATAERLGIPAVLSAGKKRDVSLSAKAWAPYASGDPWLTAWCDLARHQTHLKFFEYLREPVVRPTYNPLLLTGRTSAANPNLQNCYSPDTELLTSRGWVRFDALDEDDLPEKVAQFDPSDSSVSFVEPEEWIEQKWSKPLVQLTSDNVNLLVTHDHNMLVRDGEGGYHNGPAGDYPAGSDGYEQPHGGLYAGGDGDSGDSGDSPVNDQNLLLYLLAFQADGTWKDNLMSFHLSRDDKIKKLVAALKALKARFRVQNAPNGSTYVEVPDQNLAKLTHSLLGPDKLFGPWLLSLSRKLIDFFVEEVWHWDGETKRKTGYCSEHLHNANWVQILCLLSNRRAQVREYTNNGGQVGYLVDHTEDASSSPCSAIEANTTKSPGKVYCVRVPSGYVVVRRDGKAAVAGNCPRDSEFRKLFVAREGHKLMTVDYSYIELRTLAAVCEQRFGYSKLADTIRSGIDPHVYTAALILDTTVEDFLALKTTNPSQYKRQRQSAKSLNFGVPGGLGAAKLAAYAAATYKVEMTVEDAAKFRHLLTTRIYPEIGEYLDSGAQEAFCWTTGVSKSAVCRVFDIDPSDNAEFSRTLRSVSKVLRGKPVKADGTPYRPQYVDRLWRGIQRLAEDMTNLSASDRKLIAAKKGSYRLERKLLVGPAITPTGRIRGGATYTQRANTPFQGLAADGAKLGLFRLLANGYRTLLFVHDELVIELPDTNAAELERQISEINFILNDSMEQVLGRRLPCATEHNVERHWAKE